MTRKTRNTRMNATMDWLMHRNRQGIRRIGTLTFGRLDRIYRSRQASPAVRKVIRNECRRCGYTLVVLDFNRWN